MRNIRLIWIGKSQESFVQDGIKVYLKKISHYSKVDFEEIFVNTGEHLIAFSEIQLEGKKRMSVSDFMKGNNIQMGDKLGE